MNSLSLSLSIAPDGVPMVKNYTSPYNEDYTQIRLYWSGINDSLWNGINNTYIVDMFDVTTDAATNNRGRYLIYRSPRDIYDLTVTSLTVRRQDEGFCMQTSIFTVSEHLLLKWGGGGGHLEAIFSIANCCTWSLAIFWVSL